MSLKRVHPLGCPGSPCSCIRFSPQGHPRPGRLQPPPCPLPPSLPQERPLSHRGSSSSDGQLLGTLPAGSTTRGERRGPHAALPARFFQTPVTSRRRPATPQGPGSVPFTCTTTRDGPQQTAARPPPLLGGVAGQGSGDKTEGQGRESWGGAGHIGGTKTGRSGAHQRRGTHSAGGAGMGGSAGYGGGTRGRGGRRRGGPAGGGAGQGAGPAAVPEGPRRRSRAEGSFRPAASASGSWRACALASVVRGRPGFRCPRGRCPAPASMTRSFISGPRRGPGLALPGGARLGDAPQVSAPRPPPGPLGSPRRVGASEGRPAVPGHRAAPAPGRMEGRGCSRGITQQAREGLGVLPGFISVASAP